jgi:hypothetical protein
MIRNSHDSPGHYPSWRHWSSNVIPADLAGGERQAYKFNLSGTPQGYSAHAVPVAFAGPTMPRRRT